MNDKFFDLSKEKQDRMINAALKVFAINGYKRASTDDMVKEAGISKGLLFHYFGSKIGLYSFLLDYSIKYITLETSSFVSTKEQDFFTIYQQLLNAQIQLMRTYPYIHSFLTGSVKEKSAEITVDLMDKIHSYEEYMESFFVRMKKNLFNEKCNYEQIRIIMNYTIEGLLEDSFRDEIFAADDFYAEAVTYLTMMRTISYK